ncbi:nickel-dependent hydrogenase large subunit [Xanthobacter sp. V4C-4]|uniref:nickel-dependent hydrogenase large subunit n=1 Tax=Xanthobacter cornucopiae TaxID=3119924 RepID=UPI003729B8B7
MTGATLQRIAIVCDPAHAAAPWRVARTLGPDPARALEGRPPEEVARLVPRVFNLCGAAHGFAAARALGLPAVADTLAMMRESVRDHALAILHGWPTLLDGAPDRAALRALARPGEDGARAITTALVGAPLADHDFGTLTGAELDAWLVAGDTATARILARLRRLDPAEGRAGLPELGAVDILRALSARLAPDAGPSGEAAPAHRETGALGRVAATPLFAGLIAHEGPSLFVRLLARLADLLALLRAPPPAWPESPPGLGLAEAARGLLGHAARVEAGRVTHYRILSPSTWNLTPGGLLDRAFAALSPSPDAPLLARFLLSALNPCVPVTLDFQGARADA